MGIIERSGIYSLGQYRFPPDIELVAITPEGGIQYKVGPGKKELGKGLRKVVSEEKKNFTGKDFGFRTLLLNNPKSYEFKTKVSLMNHGMVNK
ncbi:MAG: hypothetical protein L6420_10630 [Elusimicrobia bacterium]|nr:hypothetical protein [Elusimicrobiota bacterium]